MWPDLFGPGWIWGVLSALGLLALFVGLVLVLGDPVVSDNATDAVQRIWHRYEQGDLTRPEFERARAFHAAAGAKPPSASLTTHYTFEMTTMPYGYLTSLGFSPIIIVGRVYRLLRGFVSGLSGFVFSAIAACRKDLMH